MKFLGNDSEFTALKDNQENLIDSLLMNAFNAGYSSCNMVITDLYTQAKKAVEQDIDPKLIQGQNPFIDILVLYKDKQKPVIYDTAKVEEPGLEGM